MTDSSHPGLISIGLSDCSDGSAHNLKALETCVTIPPNAVKQLSSAVEAVKEQHCISVNDLPFNQTPSDGKELEIENLHCWTASATLYSVQAC